MKSYHLAFIFVLIIALFVGAPLAQSWGDSNRIPQQKMLHTKDNKRNAVALTTISDTGIRLVRFWNYGKLRAEQWRGPNKVNVSDLIELWDQYDVYYEGWIYDNPSAVLFDPKGDDRWAQITTFMVICIQRWDMWLRKKLVTGHYGLMNCHWHPMIPFITENLL
jgi:hypothetical protein